jgi:hypothetical protein
MSQAATGVKAGGNLSSDSTLRRMRGWRLPVSAHDQLLERLSDSAVIPCSDSRSRSAEATQPLAVARTRMAATDFLPV